MGRLDGRVALVTGGSAGIGLATAQAFAGEGARVVIGSRDRGRGEAAVEQVRASGGEAHFRATDVPDAAAIEALVSTCVERFGRLDCAFNNAATGGPGELCADVAEADFDQVVAVNLRGVWLCLKHEIRQMLRQGGGAIVNMSSVDGLTGSPNSSVYSASKHAVDGLTRSAAVEYAASGVRVNAVCAGGIATEMLARGYGHDLDWVERYRRPAIPIGRLGRPEECAEAVVWLCSDAASYVTGVCLPVDGGLLADSASYLPLRPDRRAPGV
ncbi:MAG TPA: glucose 1-dehydrogenase [Candidatus Dormibacteraeota bacterium]|nr:glucose 1-dehydrogenase [Candidatus Dormibacteraeota bacterium]